MEKPIIGIISKHYKEYKKNERTDTYIRDEVKQAIFDNGAVAIGLLPPDREIKRRGDNWREDLSEEEYDNLISQIKLCNGIVFQGGMSADNYENIAAKYCYKNNIPTLGICCGQNIIVRAIGGTTYEIPNPKKHLQHSKKYVHSVKIDTTSKFYQIVKKEEIMVNSRHKKTIKDCPNLDKVGFCEDGYSDVVEAKDKDFYIGVRFHPESLYTIDDNMNNIFKSFIEVCKKRRNSKEFAENNN